MDKIATHSHKWVVGPYTKHMHARTHSLIHSHIYGPCTVHTHFVCFTFATHHRRIMWRHKHYVVMPLVFIHVQCTRADVHMWVCVCVWWWEGKLFGEFASTEVQYENHLHLFLPPTKKKTQFHSCRNISHVQVSVRVFIPNDTYKTCV